MRYLRFTIYFCIILLLNSSCGSDFLDLYPISSQTTGTFYNTAEDFDQALNACYKQLQDFYDAYSTHEGIVEAKSDDVLPGPYATADIARFIDDADNSYTASFWSTAFSVITSCNQVITYIDDATEEISDKDEIIGQVRFIRGLVYFDMVRLFGGLPLYNKVYDLDEYYKIARSSVDSTYQFIYNDFLAAASALPGTWSDDDLGKATSYAAKGFLAKAYLYNKEYSKSLTLLNEIIDSENYEFFNNWMDIWNEDNDNGPQALFQIQFITGTTSKEQGCQYLSYCAPEFIAKGDLADGKYPLGGASTQIIVSEDLYNSFEDGDIRRDTTICTRYLNQSGTWVTANYFVWKFTHGAVIPSTTEDWGLNRTLLRYTDILMMKAECINAISGPTSEAVTIINDVRNRAGLADLTSDYTSSSDAFFNAIVRERRHEFAFENQRWFDLVRWGIAEDVMNPFLAEMEVNTSRSMESYQELFPIPAEQIEIIGDESVLWQNTGY